MAQNVTVHEGHSGTIHEGNSGNTQLHVGNEVTEVII